MLCAEWLAIAIAVITKRQGNKHQSISCPFHIVLLLLGVLQGVHCSDGTGLGFSLLGHLLLLTDELSQHVSAGFRDIGIIQLDQISKRQRDEGAT